MLKFWKVQKSKRTKITSSTTTIHIILFPNVVEVNYYEIQVKLAQTSTSLFLLLNLKTKSLDHVLHPSTQQGFSKATGAIRTNSSS